MKSLFRIKYCVVLVFILALSILTYYVFLDGYFVLNFRDTQTPISSTEKVDLKGLNELYASGGPMIQYESLKDKLKHFKGEKIVVDAIGSESGFVRGFPSTYFSYQQNPPEWRYYLRRLLFTGSIDVRPELFIPEEVEAKKYGFKLVQFKIGSKFATTPEAVDQFVTFFDSLPPNTWVHFHCRGGKGRTTMMLVMYDIMKNAPDVTLADIVKRQHLLGSVDLFDTTAWSRGTYRVEALQERKAFIEKFYAFVLQRKAGGTQNWSDWTRQQKVTPS